MRELLGHLIDIEPAVRIWVVLLLVSVIEDTHELLARARAAYKALQLRRGWLLLRRKKAGQRMSAACTFLDERTSNEYQVIQEHGKKIKHAVFFSRARPEPSKAKFLYFFPPTRTETPTLRFTCIFVFF